MADQPLQISIVAFWQRLGAMLARLLAERAHADLTITVRDGKIQRVGVNSSYLPDNLPNVPK